MINLEMIGHLGQDAKCQTLQDGRFLINFSVCDNVKQTDKQTGEIKEFPQWVSVSYFTKSDKVLPYLKKGVQVYVSGDFRIDEYLSKQTNQVLFSAQVTATRVQILIFDEKKEEQK
jgi:single stranded DNA-binding protein